MFRYIFAIFWMISPLNAVALERSFECKTEAFYAIQSEETNKPYKGSVYKNFSFEMFVNEREVQINAAPTLYDFSFQPDKIIINEYATDFSVFSPALSVDYALGNLMFTRISYFDGILFNAKCTLK